jgi:hypothetical protein
MHRWRMMRQGGGVPEEGLADQYGQQHKYVKHENLPAQSA